jgi:2-dehydro-3-deoxyphosphogluconate aldolase/(4S)-4-hydroxy-2-oxoglutarate aldolase
MPLKKLSVLNPILESGVIAIIRADASEQAPRIAEACAKGGIRVLEITFTVPGAAGLIETLAKQYEGQMILGAGTVLDPETARIAILSGAQFVVSPALNPATARLCNRYQVPHMPGAGSVKEILEAMEAGADIVKIFPSEGLGPGFVKSVRSPLPQAALMPTGGVSLANAADWIKAGCVAVGVSTHLTGMGAGHDSPTITQLARQFIDTIRKARG